STFVVSAKGYVTSQANCAIQWLTETAGSDGPIYSAHMRCSSLTAPQETTEVNQIIVSNDRGQLSAGPEFKNLKSYRLCPRNYSGGQSAAAILAVAMPPSRHA